MKRAAFRNEFGAPPANTVTSYQACYVGCVGGLGVLRCAAKLFRWRESDFARSVQLRRPATLLPSSRRAPRGYSVTVLGYSTREMEPSLPVPSWPRQASVLPLYSVTAITARGKMYRFSSCRGRCRGRWRGRCQKVKRRNADGAADGAADGVMESAGARGQAPESARATAPDRSGIGRSVVESHGRH